MLKTMTWLMSVAYLLFESRFSFEERVVAVQFPFANSTADRWQRV